jgi:long-chain acyl-CoA synthetase
MNLYEVFHQTACRQPARPAILGPGQQDVLSYAVLDGAIRSASDKLRAAGVRLGNSVGLHCRSGAEYIICTYAVWRCGGCLVPIPVELAASEKQQIGRQIALDFVISEKRIASSLGSSSRQGGAEPTAGTVVLPSTRAREHPEGFRQINSAFVRFTSGTTSASKGVVLSHESIYDRIEAANEVLHIGPGDRVLWLLSMSYHFTVSIVSYLSFGAAIVLVPVHIGQAIVDAGRQHGGTLIYGSPAHYAFLAGAEQPDRLPDLRLALSTATALDIRTAEKFRERFGVPVAQALGIIEVGLPCINLDFAADRPGAVGRVLPAYRLRMEDVGLGQEQREILFSGKGFLDAYYDPWRTRVEIMPDGWFRTGDVGELDADGCLFIRGRVKDVISVLGMKFFPQEVEAVLMSHPRIASASVFARPDALLGEVAHARVVVRAGSEGCCSESELLAYCRKRLAGFEVPQRIEFVSALPQTASGKVLHRDVQPRAEASQGNAES